MFEIGGERHEWMEQGECVVRVHEVLEINRLLGYDMFYPTSGNSDVAKKWSDKFCRSCPVKVTCFTYAVENNEQGTWGGDTAKVRRRLVRLYRKSPLTLLKQPEEQLQDESSNPSEVLNPDRESA